MGHQELYNSSSHC